MELEPNSLDWNGNEKEHELELEDMKHTYGSLAIMAYPNSESSKTSYFWIFHFQTP